LFTCALIRGEGQLTRPGRIVEADLTQRLRQKSVRRRTHKEAQVVDRGEVTECLARRRIQFCDGVVNDPIQPFELISAALLQDRRDRFIMVKFPGDTLS